MQIGKIPGKKLEEIILNKITYKRDDVLLHAGLGEDSAVVDLKGDLLAIASDPITGTSKNAGYLAVHVACNDLAAVGAEPVGIQVILLLPETIREEEIACLMHEIIETAASIKVEVLGGHTEIISLVSQPITCVTAVGRVKREQLVSSSGARPGDDILITKGVGIEGTYILANDYADLLKEKGVSQKTIDEALKYKDKLSVLKEGLLAAEYGVHAMHDVTEGGLYGALEELSQASNTGFELYLDELPVRTETREITEALGIDPAGLISSGSLLITVPEGERMIEFLEEEGVHAWKIGAITAEGRTMIRKGRKEVFSWSNKDELWRLME